MLKNKFILGGAQFGNKYGAFNKDNEVNLQKLTCIINFAKKNHLNFIDTSPDYGNSESMIGNLNTKNFKIITKIPKIENTREDPKKVIEKIIEKSLNNLKTNNLYGILFRSPSYLLKEPFFSIWEEAKKLKRKNLFKKVGITIYEPDELDLVFEKLKPEIVQFPYNLFDQRMKNSGWIDVLYKKEVELHARSVFLQGLLLTKYKDFPAKFSQFQSEWFQYHNWLKKNNISAIDACINFILLEKKITKIIVGIESVQQLREIVNIKFKNIIYSNWKKNIDEKLYNPLKW